MVSNLAWIKVGPDFRLNFGPGSTFFKTNKKSLNSGRILSRAQNWAEKQAQLSEKILLGLRIDHQFPDLLKGDSKKI
jgi:hypothetical protein